MKQRKGISMVLTTLIIVAASVVLGTAVSLYGTSLFQSSTQTGGFQVSNVHVWQGLNGTEDTVLGALAVRNSGDKFIAVSDISIRGIAVPFKSWYVAKTSETTSAVMSKSLAYQSTDLEAVVDLDKDTVADLTTALAQGSAPINLNPGDATIIYFIMPGSNSATLNPIVKAEDVGASTTVHIAAGSIAQATTVTVAKNA